MEMMIYVHYSAAAWATELSHLREGIPPLLQTLVVGPKVIMHQNDSRPSLRLLEKQNRRKLHFFLPIFAISEAAAALPPSKVSALRNLS